MANSARLGSFLIAVLAMVACSSSKAKPEGSEQAQPQEATGAHKRGFDNAHAMVDNAALCEPRKDRAPNEAACKRACELNHSNSCANWASLVRDRDAARALALYARACKGGSGIGCEGQARMVLAADGDASKLFRDARRYHRIHCSQGYGRSCAQLAALFESDLGGKPMPGAAKSFRQEACRLGYEPGCP